MKEIVEKEYWETCDKLGEVKRSYEHQVVKVFAQQRIEFEKQYLDWKNVKNALDVGAGTGYSSFYLSQELDLTTLDFSSRNLRKQPSKNKIQASAYNLPFNSNSFDLVYGWDFLHHLENPEKAVQEMARVSRRYLVLFEPNRNNPIQFIYGLLNEHERGTLSFNKKKLMNLMKVVGFKLIICKNVGWIFAGATPTSLLRLVKKIPFTHKLGISVVIVCEKP